MYCWTLSSTTRVLFEVNILLNFVFLHKLELTWIGALLNNWLGISAKCSCSLSVVKLEVR